MWYLLYIKRRYGVMEILFTCLIVLLTTSGQILLKKGAIYRNEKIKSFQFIGLGYFLFILTIIFTYLLMKLVPMKYFTVIMSLSYIAVMFSANIFLNEKLERKKVIGTVLIVIGIMVFMYE